MLICVYIILKIAPMKKKLYFNYIMDKTKSEDNDGNGNLANNQVDTNIDPDTIGNYVYISLCSCSINVSCTIS